MLLAATILLACKGDAVDTGDSRVQASGPVTCADPGLRESLGPWEEHEVAAAEDTPGAGVVLADFDGDGLLDLFLPDLVSCSLLRGSGDGTFVDLTDTLPDLGTCDAWGGVAVDAEGDGDLDIFVTRLSGPNALLVNDGAGGFTDGTDAWGLSAISRASMSAAWADLDRDGDLDAFVSNHSPNPVDSDAPANPDEDVDTAWGTANTLMRNEGGAFSDVSHRLSDDDRYGFTFMSAFLDMNDDTVPDIYMLNDFGDRAFANRYLRSECKGNVCRLEDATEESALDLEVDAMGMGIGDLNGDSLPDMAITDNYRLHLLLSEGESGLWYDASASMGLWPDKGLGQRNAWGGELVDLDLDGDLDFLATFGPTEKGIREDKNLGQPDGLWLQEDGQFSQPPGAWGFAHDDIGRGFAVGDLNNDGHPDVVKRRYKGGPTVVLASRCSDAAWLKVQLANNDANPFAVGAVVIATVDGQPRTRWIHAGSSSLASGGPPEALFGLGTAETVERLEIRWPGGGVDVVEDVAVNQTVIISR